MKGWEIKNRQVWKWVFWRGFRGGILGFCETTGVGFVFEKKEEEILAKPQRRKGRRG
jgi:hypothetical protein